MFQYYPLHPQHAFSKTIYALFDWNVCHLYEGPEATATLTPDHWMPPPPGWLKLNFHGAYNHQTGTARIGRLAWDHYGQLLMAFTSEVTAAHPLEAELMA